MGVESFLLNFRIMAENLAGPAMKSFAAEAKGVAEGARTAFLAIGAGAAAAVVESLKLAESFDVQIRHIAALADGTTANIDEMKKSVLDLSTQIPKSADDLAAALYLIRSSGFSGAEGIQILDASAKAATSGLTETKVVADAVTSALVSYKLGGADAADITGKLIAAVTAGKTEVGDLAGAFGRVLPLAAASGVNFDQVAASLATMTRTGLKADEAATALRGAIVALEVPHSKAVKVIEDLGMTVDEVRKDMLTNYMGTLEMMMEKTHGNVEMLSALFPNIRAFTGVLSTAGSQGKQYAEILNTISKAGKDANDNAFAITMQGAGPQLDLLKNQLEAIAIELGTKLLPYLVDLAKWAREAVVVIMDWIKANPDFAKFAGIALAVAAGLSAISLVIGPLIALLGSPILLPLLAVGAGIVVLKKVWDDNLGGIQEKTKSVTDNVGSFLAGVKKGFEEQTTKTIPDYSDAYDNLTRSVNPFRESIQKVTLGLPPLTTEMDKSNKLARDYTISVQKSHEEMTKWEERGRKVGEALAWLWEKVLQPVGAWLVDAFITQIENVIDAVTHLIDAIGNAISLGQKIGSTIGGFVQGAQSTIGGLATQVFATSWNNGVPSDVRKYGGGGFVPTTGLAYLHAGEQVLTPAQQKSDDSGGQQPVHVWLDGELLMRAMGARTVEAARLSGRVLGR